MYDVLRASYRFHCPSGPRARGVAVRLSQFRRVERLDGPAHPAVYRVVWACGGCGQDHLGLGTHDELDYAPFVPSAPGGFWDPLTGRIGGSLGDELAQAAADRLRRGVWPWSFWCSAEERMRPGYPSALAQAQIPAGAQLLALADAWDTMTSGRPYRAPLSTEEALAEVDRCAGTHLRPDAGVRIRAALAWLGLSESSQGHPSAL